MNVGDKISVGDKIRVEWRGAPYPAKVVKLEDGKILIHYVKYNGRHDEWLGILDDRVLWPRLDKEQDVSGSSNAEEQDMSDDSLKSCLTKSCDDSSEDESIEDDTGGIPDQRTAGTTPSAQALEENVPSQRSSTPRPGSRSPDGVGNPDRRTTPEDLGNAECGFCGLMVGDRKVKCSGCSSLFHGEPMCLGVKRSTVDVLLTETSGAILYRCCNCRFQEAPAGEGLVQLSRIVGELVREVRSAGTKVQPQSVRPLPSAPRTHGSNGGTGAGRDEILSQIRELREREKRRSAIIFRGLGDVSVGVLSTKFGKMCEYLGVGRITLGNVRKVGNGIIYRAVIEDDDKRRELLSKCHRLRSSTEFSRVYINRDLTHQQRQDLREKRQQTRGAARGNDQASPEVNTGESLNRSRTARRDEHLTGANAVMPNLRHSFAMPSRLTTRAAPRGRGRGRPPGRGRSRGSGRGRIEASPSYGSSVRDQVFTNSSESLGRNGDQARGSDIAGGEQGSSRRLDRSASQRRRGRPNQSGVSIGSIPHNRRNLNF